MDINNRNGQQEKEIKPLKCEKELIPVLAGECRASPMTLSVTNLIRSSSAEVMQTF